MFVFDAIAGAQTGDENGGKLRGSDCLMIPTVSRITLVILIIKNIGLWKENLNYERIMELSELESELKFVLHVSKNSNCTRGSIAFRDYNCSTQIAKKRNEQITSATRDDDFIKIWKNEIFVLVEEKTLKIYKKRFNERNGSFNW